MTSTTPGAADVWRPGWPVALHATLGPMRRGAGDPAYRVDRDGAVWRTTRTPDGPATLHLSAAPRAAEVHATAWGPGAAWAVASVPDLLGACDRPDGFVPEHPVLLEAARRYPVVRVPRSRRVLEALVPAVVEQKVTGSEAWRSWRELLWRFGEPAPGPAPPGMHVVPDAAAWARIPSWEWHRAGVDARRSATIVRASRAAARLEECADLALPEAWGRLRSLLGVGEWTSAEVAQRALGDPDAVSVGDFHLAGFVGWALAGERGADDARMLELLAPYSPHRYRAVRLLELAVPPPPRRAPRYRHRDHRSI